MEFSSVIMSVCTFLVGLAIGYYKSLTDMSKLYCLKSDCLEIRSACVKHKEHQDKQIDDARSSLSQIKIDIAEIKTTLKAMADK